MPDLGISGRMNVATLEKKFRGEFHLSLRVYQGQGRADGKVTLAKVGFRKRTGSPSVLSIRKNMKIKTVENTFQKAFGLKVQVAGFDDTYLCDNSDTISVAESRDVKRLRAGDKKNRKSENLQHVFGRPTADLINDDENLEVEFKETFSLNTKTQMRKDDRIRHAALREITGFLNTADGILLIGVRDKKNQSEDRPEIAGIKVDGFDGDQDKYIRQIYDVVKSALGEIAAGQLDIKIELVGAQYVCRIECQKGKREVYCNYKNFGAKPFVRHGSSTSEPSHKEWVDWIKTKFSD